MKYKLQNAKYKIQNTKYKVLWLCGVEKGGAMPQMASMEKNDPIDNLVEHLKYKIQRARQWTKHIDSIRKDDLFYILILLYLYLSLFVADSAQTEYCSTFHCPFVRPCVTGVTSHISHIYKGINAMLIIRRPIKPCKF